MNFTPQLQPELPLDTGTWSIRSIVYVGLIWINGILIARTIILYIHMHLFPGHDRRGGLSRVQELFQLFCESFWREAHRDTAKADPGLLTQSQIDLIAARRWREVLVWIVFQPHELLFVDKKQQSALHHACLFRAPAQIIEMLLYQAPELARMANSDQELPLHWAVRLSMPKEVLKWLLAVHPESGCVAKDREGNTALSLVWKNQEADLLNLWWASGRQAVLESPRWQSILFFLNCYSSFLQQKQDSFSPTTIELEGAYETLVQHKKTFQPLHTATHCCNVPSPLFALILQVYQDDLQRPDPMGRLPLAIACLDPVSNRSVGAFTKIHLMVAGSPEAVAHRDHCGRLPLHLALENGFIWEEGIDRLIQVAPKSVLVNDPISGLPCFLLAATGSQRREGCLDGARGDPMGESLSLSTIFRLLRSDPAQLSLLKS